MSKWILQSSLVVGAFGTCLLASIAMAQVMPIPTPQGGGVQTIPGRCDDANGDLKLFPFSDSLAIDDATTADVLNRDGKPSTCAKTKTPQAFAATGLLHFKQYPFKNRNAASTCVTVTINQTSQVNNTQGELQAAAYADSFNPADLTQNYLGDTGVALQTGKPQDFSFNVGGTKNFVIVVNEYAPGGLGSYDLTVKNCGTVLIQSVSPNFSQQAGGRVVTITGLGFLSNPPLSGPPTVFFGPNQGTNVQIDPNNETSITVTVPPANQGFQGPVDVTVRNADGSQATLTNGLTYYAPIQTQLSVTAVPSPAPFGTAVRVFARISDVKTPPPEDFSGTVAFTLDSDPTATVIPVSPQTGLESASFANLSVGQHTVHVHYSGSQDAIYQPADGLITFTVNKAPTTTGLTLDNNPVAQGSNGTFTAIVASGSQSATRPSGTVTFTIDGVDQTPVQVGNSGVVHFTTTTPPANGSHTVKATYSGDGNYLASSSAPATEQVNATAATVVVASSNNPSVFGQDVTFTVTVTGQGTVNGQVQLNVDGTDSGAAKPVVNGQVVFDLATLSGGAHSVKASFAPSDVNNGASSGSVVQNVNPEPTTTTFTAAPQTISDGDTITFTVTVTANNQVGTPTGTVSVFANGQDVQDVPLAKDGTATFQKAGGFPLGTVTVTVQYNGDTQKDFATSTSAPATITVNPLGSDGGVDGGTDAAPDAAPDAEVPDATDDGGDAAMVDAGQEQPDSTVDAGPDDAGSDANLIDLPDAARPSTDAGDFLGGAGLGTNSGCGCDVAGLPIPSDVGVTLALGGVALVLARRRRR